MHLAMECLNCSRGQQPFGYAPGRSPWNGAESVEDKAGDFIGKVVGIGLLGLVFAVFVAFKSKKKR